MQHSWVGGTLAAGYMEGDVTVQFCGPLMSGLSSSNDITWLCDDICISSDEVSTHSTDLNPWQSSSTYAILV